MIEQLRTIQQEKGAILDGEGRFPLSFADESDISSKIERGVAIYDRTHWGLLEISDQDCLRYLHNQSTNDFESLSPGQGCDTVFVTSTARTIDLATAYILDDAAWVLVSPDRRQHLLQWLDRFIFPFDRVLLKDISAQYGVFNLIGSQSDTLLTNLGVEEALDKLPLHSHQLVSIADIEVRIAVGNGLQLPGYTLLVPIEQASVLWSKLVAQLAIPIGEHSWEQLRIQQGRPKSDRELTEDYNPLEAGLWQTISFEKGCYIGQETIARLNTYKGVKQRLWGIELSQPTTPGTSIVLDGQKVGVLTSCTKTATGEFGLGYVRTKAGGNGLQVQVGDSEGKITTVPFLTHED